MAKDIALDENFDVFIDDRNDLGMVEGRQEVEQSIALQVTLYFYEEIGATDLPNVEDRLELQARRVANENRRISSVGPVVVEELDEQGGLNTYEVTINYDQTEDFTFEVGG